ncbi:dephospho-CoA kinase [Glaciecola sp. 1036]|uniref:dephospho-CoA kinase n=1 Tax=Alteromonadaceae TaxID=72275 RepID=UPI003D02B53C
MKNKYIVGLTGGIASGKTSVSNLFADKGIDVIDADVVAREVVMPGEEALQAIHNRFGDQALTKQGSLDRAWMRERVFHHPEDKNWLNSLLHPLIRQRMLNQCQSSTSQYCILAVPLLIESSLKDLVDRILVVDIPEELQLERALSRDGSSPETIKNIIAAQINRQMRLDAADDVIDNSQDISNLNAQVAHLHNSYLQLSEAKYSAQ